MHPLNMLVIRFENVDINKRKIFSLSPLPFFPGKISATGFQLLPSPNNYHETSGPESIAKKMNITGNPANSIRQIPPDITPFPLTD